MTTFYNIIATKNFHPKQEDGGMGGVIDKPKWRGGNDSFLRELSHIQG